MYTVKRTKHFERSFKKLSLSGAKASLKKDLAVVIDILASGKKLPQKYKDHQLKGELEEYRECHVRADFLLVYRIIEDELVLVLVDIGTHSYLF